MNMNDLTDSALEWGAPEHNETTDIDPARRTPVAHQPSLLGAIRRHAQERPTARALLFLDAEGQEQIAVTWAGVYADAGRAAKTWQAAGTQPGDIVLIALDHTYDLVAAFLGALYAGAVPLILPYRRPGGDEAYGERLALAVQHTQSRVVFCTEAVMEIATRVLAMFDCRVQIFARAQMDASPTDLVPYPRAPSGPHHLQLTSGTTGSAKLAILSEVAILTKIHNTFAARYRTRAPLVGCAPFSHSGGLISSLLTPLVMGQTSVHLHPAVWVTHPHLLWQTVTTYRGAVTFIPNFALNLLVNRIPDPQSHCFDLSSLHSLIVGGELVIYKDLQRFYGHFQVCGLRETALSGGYGMSEQASGISGAAWETQTTIDWVDRDLLRSRWQAQPVAATDPGAQAVVSCGVPFAGVEVRIVDDDFRELPERQIGQLLLRSQQCFSGYLNRPDLTAQVMRNGWYCTGDLGYLADGEIYILGRKDDLIIIGGQNIQPQAIEEIATAVLGAQGGRVVAFGLRDEDLGTQTAVLICETLEDVPDAQLAAWRAAITQQVYAQLEITLADLRFVPKGWVVQMDTKIGRAASREKYLGAGFRPEALGIALLRAAGENAAWLEQGLLQLAGQMLGDSPAGPEDDFFTLGGDSLTALRFVLAVEEATGRRVPTEFFREPTVAHLVRLLVGEPASTPAMTQEAAALPPATQRTVSWRRRVRSLPQRALVQVRSLFEAQAFRRPYFEGVQWLLRWCDQSWVQELLYPRKSQLVRRFAESMGTPTAQVAQAVALSLASDALLSRWLTESNPRARPGQRKSVLIADLEQALKSELGSSLWEQYITIDGAERVEDAIAAGRGIILLGLHSPTRFATNHYWTKLQVPKTAVGMRTYGAMAQQLQLAHDSNDGHVGWWTQARAAVAAEAYQILLQGGLIAIAGDEQNVVNGRPAVIGDRLHRLSPGFAELAAATGAAVLPFYSKMLDNGRVRIVIAPPLTWEPSASRSEQTIALVQAHARMQSALWRDMPSVVSKEIMVQHLALPYADEDMLVNTLVPSANRL